MNDTNSVLLLNAFLAAGDEETKSGNTTSAEHFYKESVRFAQSNLGLHSAQTALAHYSLSAHYLEQNEWNEAAFHSNAALGIFTTVFGKTHPTTAMVLHHIAEICESQNLSSVAYPIRLRVAEIFERHRDAIDFSVPRADTATLLIKRMMSADGTTMENWLENSI